MGGKKKIISVKKVIIIAYKFPPYAGVGARRWGKMADYFAQNGIDTTVYCGDWETKESFSWNKKRHPNLNVVKITNPIIKFRNSNPFFHRISFRLETIINWVFKFTDDGSLFTVLARKKIKKHLKTNTPDAIIATGGPFSINYFAAKLKQEYPHVKVFQDFRDVWMAEYFHQFPTQTKKHWKYIKQKKMEAFSIKNCDDYISVTPGCIERFKHLSTNYPTKGKVILNGFDKRDKPSSFGEFPDKYLNAKKINISHFGTLNFGREKNLHKLLIDFHNIKNIEKENIIFNLFGYFEPKTKEIIKNSDYAKYVNFYNFIPPAEVQTMMYYSDLHLVINDDVYFYAFGSKIYDAFLYKKGVVYLSKNNELSSIIKENNLGVTSENNTKGNTTLINTILNNVSKIKEDSFFNKNYDFDKHSIENISKEYIELLKL